MEFKRQDISYDPQTGKLTTCIVMKLADGNGMMLKAKAELYADIMEGIDKLVEATIAEFAVKYGEEVIKFTHNVTDDDLRDTEPAVRFVDSKEVSRQLLKRAFPNEKGGA